MDGINNHFDPKKFQGVLSPVMLIGRSGEEYGQIIPVYDARLVIVSAGGVRIPVRTLTEREQLIQDALDEDARNEEA